MTRPRISRLASTAVLAVAVGLPLAAATTYTITDLGSLGGGATYGLAINASGQVTGQSVLSELVQVPCPPQRYGGPQKCFAHPDHAFVWSNGTMTDLGTLGGLYSRGVAISDSGEVVGTSSAKSNGASGTFLWNGRTMKPLSAPGRVYGINDSAQIVGQCYTSMFLQSFACAVSDGAVTALPESNPDIGCLEITTIPGQIPDAVSINNNGQILGNCIANGGSLPVVWTNDTPTVLPTLGGGPSSGTAISGNGNVVGTAQTSTGADDGFLVRNGTMTDLGSNFSPAAVNDSGVVVGGPFVYSGTLQNLNNLIPPGSPYQIQNATGINNNGQIVANALDTATGQHRALLLTPN